MKQIHSLDALLYHCRSQARIWEARAEKFTRKRSPVCADDAHKSAQKWQAWAAQLAAAIRCHSCGGTGIQPMHEYPPGSGLFSGACHECSGTGRAQQKLREEKPCPPSVIESHSSANDGTH